MSDEPDPAASELRPAAAPRPATPPQIPGYRIDGVIGRGTTGTVYRAVQLAVERDVAVKVLHPELAARPQVVQRLQREARTMAKLAHPHVVGAIDMGESEGRWWFAMELVDGPSLAQLLRTDGALSQREALRLFAPLCEALEHLWEHGVVHRDVKPANILLERGGRGVHRHYRARLADLGLAVGERDPTLTREGGTVGTPHYIAPEQARDAREVDVRSDIWSLGATLFEAVCGRPPFEGRSAAEVLSAVLHEPITDPHVLRPNLSTGLVLVLRKCLARDPERRYQTPGELLADIERLRERRAPDVRKRELEPLARAPRPWRSAALVAAGFVLVGGAAVLGAVLASSDAGGVPGGAPGVPRDPLASVVELKAAAGEEPRLLTTALASLDSVRADAVAAGEDAAWRELRRQLVDALGREVRAIEREVSVRVDAHLAPVGRSDFEAARMELEGLERRVRDQLGVAADALPPEVFLPHQRFVDRLGERIAERRTARIEAIRRAVAAHWTSLVQPEVDRLQASERWRSARDLLVATPREVVTRASLSPVGLSDSSLSEATAEVLDAMALRRDELDRGWVDRQRALRETVEAEIRRLATVRWPELPADPADALPSALGAELERIGLVEEEWLLAGGVDAHSRLSDQVERARRDLSRELESAARGEFELRAGALSIPLGRARRYGAMQRLWDEFLTRVERVPAGLSRDGWAERLARDAATLAYEGGLLEGFMVEAGRTVRERAGQRVTMEIERSIRASGRISCGTDPLANGFTFQIEESGRPYRLHLRAGALPSGFTPVAIGDLARLIGFGDAIDADAGVDAAEPTRLLGRVCLRWYAGDTAMSRALWVDATADGPLFGSGPGADLARQMVDRLAGGGPGPVPVGDGADRLLAALDAGLAERDPPLASWVARTLLETFGDDPRVQVRGAALRDLASG